MATTGTITRERADLLETLGKSRFFLKHTSRELTDEQAGERSTVSQLCIGGLIKHLTLVERNWVRFVLEGPGKQKVDESAYEAHAASFRMESGDHLADLIAEYDQVAAVTDELIRTTDLDADHALPEAPWNAPGARWSARRVFQHLIAETAQHAGHADIIREAIDGGKSMG